jgi:hypothetical protein
VFRYFYTGSKNNKINTKPENTAPKRRKIAFKIALELAKKMPLFFIQRTPGSLGACDTRDEYE